MRMISNVDVAVDYELWTQHGDISVPRRISDKTRPAAFPRGINLIVMVRGTDSNVIYERVFILFCNLYI